MCSFNFPTLLPRSSRSWHLHFSNMVFVLGEVRCWGQSGKHMLALSFSAFDGGLNRSAQHFILD
jgi:hypothetical protein